MSEKRFKISQGYNDRYCHDLQENKLLKQYQAVKLMNIFNEKNNELTQRINRMEDELNYFKAKCGSLETGLIQEERENHKLKEENKQLKYQNEMLSNELEQCKAVIDKKWRKYLQKKEL